MRMSVRTLTATLLCLALTSCGAAAPSRAAATTTTAVQAAPACAVTWGSGDKAAGDLSVAPLIAVRTGRHDCYDRVVFEFDGSARGYTVRYSTEVLTDGEGVDLVPYTAGGAHLWVTLKSPAYDDEHAATIDARTGDRLANVLRYDTLRDVVFGGSFEGYTTLAVGVRARLPFRVTLLDGPGTHSRIVLDVAHRW